VDSLAIIYLVIHCDYLIPPLSSWVEASNSWGVISIPYLFQIFNIPEMVNKGDSCHCIHRHCQRVTLGCAFLREKCWAIHKQLSDLPVGVIRTLAKAGHTCLMLWRAASLLRELKVLLASTSSTTSVLSLWKLSHEMDCSFDARYLSSTKLNWTGHILDIILDGIEDCFWNDSPGSFTYTNWSHTRAFVQCDSRETQTGLWDPQTMYRVF